MLDIENPAVLEVGRHVTEFSAKAVTQPAGIKAIHDFRCDSALIGCILVNLVGLGKTWTTVGYLLLVGKF